MNSNPLMQLSLEQLKQAIVIRERIESLEAKLGALLGGTPQTGATPLSLKKQAKGLSASGRTRIAAAQKARWARTKLATKLTAVASPARPKVKTKTMSPEARARIASSQKARWAKLKAAKKASVKA
jgi:hypothetical protein